MSYLVAGTFFTAPFEDFDFDAEEIPDLCAMAELYPEGTRMSFSVWKITDTVDAVWIVDELDVGWDMEME